VALRCVAHAPYPHQPPAREALHLARRLGARPARAAHGAAAHGGLQRGDGAAAALLQREVARLGLR
jgi:hypothetical protein